MKKKGKREQASRTTPSVVARRLWRDRLTPCEQLDTACRKSHRAVSDLSLATAMFLDISTETRGLYTTTLSSHVIHSSVARVGRPHRVYMTLCPGSRLASPFAARASVAQSRRQLGQTTRTGHPTVLCEDRSTLQARVQNFVRGHGPSTPFSRSSSGGGTDWRQLRRLPKNCQDEHHMQQSDSDRMCGVDARYDLVLPRRWTM